MRPVGKFVKDTLASRTYGMDWTNYLNGAEIVGSQWIVEGLTIVSDVFSTTQTAVTLSGGTTGKSYLARNEIVYSGSPQQTDVRSIQISIMDR